MSYDVEMVGHASIRIHCNGKSLLTDPWYVDPINCNSLYHWPPLVHTIEELAQTTDAIYVSHVHPDHFDPRTLKHFPRSIPIYIGDYKIKAFRDELAALGFPVHEVPFQQLTAVDHTEFQIAVIESDYAESAAYDSSIVVQTPQFSVFDNNDCFLKPHKYDWVRDHFAIDYAFLGFSPASYYPICFEYENDQKRRLLQDAADRRYRDFLDAAQVLRPRVSIPFAMGIRFLHHSMLWQNVSFNSNNEAVHRAREADFRAEVLNPGDCFKRDGTLIRQNPLLSDAENERAIRQRSEELRSWIDDIWNDEQPAREDVIPQFKNWMTGIWKRNQSRFPAVRQNVIAYHVTGPNGGDFHFNFANADNEIFCEGIPAEFDMRYVYEDRLLQLRLDGKIDWDELHFSNRVSVKQNRYAADFYSMIREDCGLNSLEHSN
jgi:UDP-MurNAc hydroxylase